MFSGPSTKYLPKYVSRFELVIENEVIPRGTTVGEKVLNRRSISTKVSFYCVFKKRYLETGKWTEALEFGLTHKAGKRQDEDERVQLGLCPSPSDNAEVEATKEEKACMTLFFM